MKLFVKFVLARPGAFIFDKDETREASAYAARPKVSEKQRFSRETPGRMAN